LTLPGAIVAESPADDEIDTESVTVPEKRFKLVSASERWAEDPVKSPTVETLRAILKSEPTLRVRVAE